MTSLIIGPAFGAVPGRCLMLGAEKRIAAANGSFVTAGVCDEPATTSLGTGTGKGARRLDCGGPPGHLMSWIWSRRYQDSYVFLGFRHLAGRFFACGAS